MRSYIFIYALIFTAICDFVYAAAPLSCYDLYSTQNNTQTEITKTNLNVDIDALKMLLGKGNYSTPSVDLTLRELIQNSVDAIRAERKRTPTEIKGEIKILLDEERNYIVVTDNGEGMSVDELKKSFLTIAGSNKPLDSSGGFGLAKLPLIFGNNRFYLSTIKNGRRSSFEMNSNTKDIFIESDLAQDQKNGTIIIIEAPNTIKDVTFLYKTLILEDISIKYSKHNFENSSFSKIADSLLEKKNFNSIRYNDVAIYSQVILENYNLFSNIPFSWGAVDIYLGKEKAQFSPHSVLNNGIYQFEDRIAQDEMTRLPYGVIIDVKPNVSPKDDKYPFALNREGWKSSLNQTEIKVLHNEILKLVYDIRGKQLKERFNKIKPLYYSRQLREFDNPQNSRTTTVVQNHSPTTQESSTATKKSSWLTKIAKDFVMNQFGNNLISENNISQNNVNPADHEIENQLLQKGIDLQTPYFDNTTEIDFFSINPDAKNLFSELGTIMYMIKERLLKSEDADLQTLKNKLKDHYVGIVIDKKVNGVHFSVDSFKSISLNPFSPENYSLDRITERIYNTILHEITHTEVSQHNENFTMKLAEIRSYLANEKFNYYIEDLIHQTFERHLQTYDELNSIFQKIK